jgi:predicted O-linked N-acetylglucosamine transferase (SPINDLY family)
MALQIRQRSVGRYHQPVDSGDNKGLYQKALSLYNAGRFDDANPLIHRYLNQHPSDVDAVNLAGLIDHQTGKLETATEWLQSAIRMCPQNPCYHNNLGAVLKDNGNIEASISSFKIALDLNPEYVEAAYNLGVACQFQGELTQAMRWYEYTLSRNPDHYQAFTNQLAIYKDMGEIQKAVDGFIKSIQIHPESAIVHSNLLLCLGYLVGVTPQNMFDYHREWAERHAARSVCAGKDFLNARTLNRRIRIGYLSPDFRSHSVAFFIHPVLYRHHREQFEVYCYSDVQKPDDVTRLMMSTADHWRDILRQTDDEVFQRIREDRIDILVDLTGHTANNRMKLFSRKPAPVQVAYLGYPNTTGLTAMDYRITDSEADPEGLSDACYTERLVRLPGGFLCYQPPVPTPDVSEAPVLSNGYVTFGSFNNRAKINSSVIAVWSALLLQVPGSRLILKSSIVSDADARANLLSQFVLHGVETSRIEVAPYLPFQEHLKLYQRVDIALDTFPYNGTTTTCEALWMGIPIITLSGETHASRVGASILHQVGLTEGIATSEIGYIEAAKTLAADVNRLCQQRRTLRLKMLSSSLMDQNAFIVKLESAYRSTWENWCAARIEDENDGAGGRTVDIHGDMAIRVPNSLDELGTYTLLEQEDAFEEEIHFIRALLKPDMKVVDIGAGYGAYALTAGRHVVQAGKVWAVEPDRLKAAYLNRSVQMNGLNNVTVIPYVAPDADFLKMFAERAVFKGLDAGIDAHILDPDIDFMRIDAENLYDDLLRQGTHFFRTSSPLIQYKIKYDDYKLDIIQRFLELGYQTYRLVPGLNVLAPFHIQEKLDAFQLNLFCCKPDRAGILSRNGFLTGIEEDAQIPSQVSMDFWKTYLRNLPCTRQFVPVWEQYEQSHAGEPGWLTYQQALCLYAMSQSPEYGACVRYNALVNAHAVMMNLLRQNATAARILSTIRMALDLGYRETAVKILNHLLGPFTASDRFAVDEPFLPLFMHMASDDPGDEPGRWAYYSALEARERYRSFSSYFTGKDSLPNLETMSACRYFSPEMDRRMHLIQERFGGSGIALSIPGSGADSAYYR